MRKTRITLIVFTTMSFVLSMSAYVFGGILDKVAVSLNISISNTGLLTTMYSFGAAFGTPIVLIVFRKVEQTKMLKIMLSIAILMTLALVFIQDFGQLLFIRLAMGISCNSYGVLALSTVISLSEKERQGRSLAFLIMGSSLALVIGIPMTRALSSIFSWRSIFLTLSIIMVLCLIYLKIYLPKHNHEPIKLNLKAELIFLRDRKTLLIVLFTLIMFIGQGAFYTYVTPYLIHLFPSIETIMSLILFLIGIASLAGNQIGGYVSDRIGYAKAMLLGAVFQMVSMLLIIEFQSIHWLSVLFVQAWLMSVWFTGLQLNNGIVQATQNKSNFMISINSSSIQLGGAIGSSLAAIIISISGVQSIVFITFITSVVITMIQLYSNKL